MYSGMSGGGEGLFDGFWDRLATGWDFLKEALGMWTKDKDLIVPSLLTGIVSLLGLGLLVGFLHLTGDLSKLSVSDTTILLSPMAWFGIAVYGVASYLLAFFFAGMTVHLVDVHLQGRDARLGDAFMDALQNLPAILILALLSVIVDIVEGIIQSAARQARRSGGIGGLVLRGGPKVASGAANWVWKVVVCLMLPIIILEDVGIGRAVERGRDMHRRDLLGIGIGEVGVGLVAKALAWLVTILGAAAILGAAQVSPTLMGVAIGLTALLVTVAWSLGTFLRWSYYTMLYLWAAERERDASHATMPAPLANVTSYAPAYASGLPGRPHGSR